MSATSHMARMCAAFFIGFAMLVATGCGGGGGGGGGDGGTPPVTSNGVATCLPTTVAFGTQAINVATAPTTVTISNTGSKDLELTTLTVTGSGKDAFTITQPAQLVLAPNATTTFTVVFTPTAVAAYSATVNVPVSDTKDRGTTVRLSGNGITSQTGVVSPTPTALDFGTIVVNETSAAQTVTVTNTGNSTLTFSSSATGAVTVTGAGAAAFQVTQMDVTTLAPNASATFSVVFQPIAIQQYTATVLITALSPASSGTVTVTGIGRGPYRVDELVTLIAGDGTNMLTTGRYDFGIVEPPQSASQSFTLTNVAPDGRTVNLKQLYTTLPQYIRIVLNSQITNGGFTTTDPNPTLAAGQSTTFVMTYTSSTIERVSANANMELIGVGNINWTLSAGMQDRLYVIGNGLPIEDGDMTPRTVDLTDFGSAEVLNNGTQTRIFFINNHQDPSIILADVAVTAVSPPGSFEVTAEPPNTSNSTATTATIAGHGTKSFTIKFNAVRLGQATATVVVRSNDVMHPNYTFAITGLALAPRISVHGVPVHFDAYTRQWIEDSPIEIVDVKPNEPNLPDYPTGKGNPPNPDNTPSATYGTFFGYNPLGVARRMKYFIRNDGNWVLRLTNTPGVNFIGTMTDQFQLISAPDSTIEPGQQTTCIVEHMARFYSPQSGFQIKPGELNQQLNPTTIRIDTNDPAGQPNYIHNPFAFKINGYRNRTALTMQAVVLDGEAPYGWYNFPTISAVTGNSATTRPDLESPPLPLPPLTTAEKRIVDEYYGINPLSWSTDNAPIGPTIPHGQREARLSNRSDFGGIQRGGVETREFILRNDWNGEVQLSGSPLVNISGSHASDYTVELLGVYDAAGVNKAGATANSATVAQWFSNNPKPILAYHELLRYSVTFRPADLGTRTCQISVKTGEYNVALGVIERADPVLNTPEFEQTYTAFFNGKGLGPKVLLTSQFGVGIDRNDIPSLAKTTLFGTQCFICDRATPSATIASYTITNIGNQKLSLGQDVDEQVRVIELTNTADFTFTQPVRDGAPCLALQPGESATFTIVFAPGPVPFDPTTREEPDESLRETRVTIQTSDAPIANPQHRDGYVFTIQAVAIDPRMRLRGNGMLIYDCDFSPRDTEVLPNRSLEQTLPREWDDTVFRDMDMWGGQETHTFLLRNAGNKHILEILDPVWFDNEEIIRCVMPKEITGTMVQIPGLQNTSTTATIYRVNPITYKNVENGTREFGTRDILRCDPVYPLPMINYGTNGGYIRDQTLNTYASVLSRVRKGDGAVVFGGLFNLVGTDPNIATVCNTPTIPLDLPAPEDILRLRQNNPESYLPHGTVDEPYPRTVSRSWISGIPPLEDRYIPEGVRPFGVGGEPWSDGEDAREGWTLSNPFVGVWRYRTDTPVRGSVTLDRDAGTNVRTDPDLYIIRTSNDMTGDGDRIDPNDKAFFYAPITLNRFSPTFPPIGPGDWIRIWNLPHNMYSDHFIVQDLFSTKGGFLGGYCYNLKPYDYGLPSVPRFNLRLIDIFIEDVNGLKNGGFRVNTADAGTKAALTYLKPGFTIEFYPEHTDPSNGDLSQVTGVSNDPERFHYIDKTTSLPWPDQDSLIGDDGSYVSFDEDAYKESNPNFDNNDKSDPGTGFLNGAPYTVPEGTPKTRPKCWSFTVESVDAAKGIIRVLQASESSFAALKSDSNWGDGPNTSSASEAIVNGLIGDGLDGRIAPDNNPVYYENPENGHFSATTPHTTMLSTAGNAYYQGTFVAVVPLQCDFIDSNANRVSFVKNDVTVTGYQRTDSVGTQVTPPFSIAPGEEVSLSLRVRTRWSTGFDRWNLGDDGFGPLNGWHSWIPGTCPPGRPSPSQWISSLGWDSYDLSRMEENLDANGSRFPLTNESLTPGVHPMGEHMVEVNVNNTDVDTYRNKKTGYDSGPHGDSIQQVIWLGNIYDGCYVDETTPCYEFTLMLESRDSRIRISKGSQADGTDAYKHYESHHPNFWPDSSIRFAPDTWQLGSTPVGGAEIVSYVTIENGSPWLKGPTPYLGEDSAGGVGGDGYVATGIQAGLLRLELDRGNPFVLNGPPDFKVTVVQKDANVPRYALEDRDKAAQLLVPYASPENGSTLTNTEKIILKITFNPNVVGRRNATLTIPSNDASHPNLNITLIGTGLQPTDN